MGPFKNGGLGSAAGTRLIDLWVFPYDFKTPFVNILRTCTTGLSPRSTSRGGATELTHDSNGMTERAAPLRAV